MPTPDANPVTSGRSAHNGSSASDARPVLQFSGVSKSYGAISALRNLDLSVHAGEVHGLLGDNGAGKSTLLKIASGAISPDAGELRLNGEVLELGGPGDARQAGIETVYQDLALAEHRSAEGNLFMGRERLRAGLLGRLGVLDRKQMNRAAQETFADLSIPINDPEKLVRLMSGGQRQGVAIARAALWAKEVLLLDEPTAALGVRQRRAVFALVARLRDRGLGVLMISHDVPEMLELADRVTVLRLGEKVATRLAREVDSSWVVTAMVGAKAGFESEETSVSR